ncbi:prepilin-type N-terminal cleavage/methylation domain-containing protein [Vibrio lentus]
MKKQQGFTLIETILWLSVLSVALLGGYTLYQKRQDKLDREAFAVSISEIMEAAQSWQFQYVKNNNYDDVSYENPLIFETWPPSLDALIASPYLNGGCSLAEESTGKCLRYDGVDWSNRRVTQERSYKAFDNQYKIVIPLGDLAPGGGAGHEDWDRYNRWVAPLREIGAKQRPNYDVELSVKFLQDSIAYSEMVWRNGAKTLTDDWDIGGEHGITNAKDYTIAANDGSQISVSKRLVTIEGVSHLDTVRKPSCSKGLSPNLTLSFSESPTRTGYDYVAGFKAYTKQDNSSSWTVGIDSTLRNKNTKNLEVTHYGKATASVQCI